MSFALAHLLARDGRTEPTGATPASRQSDQSARTAHIAPQAKAMILLFQNGGPSQMELFDHKPELSRRDGQVYAERLSADGLTSLTGLFLTTKGRVKSFAVGNDAFGDQEVFAIGMDNQVYAERMSADGLTSTGFFLTAKGQVTSLSVGRGRFGTIGVSPISRILFILFSGTCTCTK